jgi:hypothetical protein
MDISTPNFNRRLICGFNFHFSFFLNIWKLGKPNRPVLAKRTYRELKLLKHIRHENIISLSDIFISPLEDIYFVTELLGTDLHRLLTSRPLEKQFIQYFLYQILVSSLFLHHSLHWSVYRGLRLHHYWLSKFISFVLLAWLEIRPFSWCCPSWFGMSAFHSDKDLINRISVTSLAHLSVLFHLWFRTKFTHSNLHLINKQILPKKKKRNHPIYWSTKTAIWRYVISD